MVKAARAIDIYRRHKKQRSSKEEVEEKYRVHGVSLKECVEENQGIYRESRE